MTLIVYCMTTVKINKEVKDKIPFEGTYDERVNKLIDLVEEDMVLPDHDVYARKTSINLSNSTLDRLRGLSLTESESYENIILRLMERCNK